MKLNWTCILRNMSASKEYLLDHSIIKNLLIVESLENMFLTAQLEIADKGGLIETFPVTGSEIFEIELIQEDESDKFKKVRCSKKILFEIFDIRQEMGISSNVTNYTFSLCEKGFFKLFNKKYSRSYKQKKISEIVEDIFKYQLNFTDPYEIEATTEKINFIIPFWKPTTTIKYLSKIAQRNKQPQEAGYIFFSSLSGINSKVPMKQFVSLSTLLEKKSLVDENEKYYLKNKSINNYYINNIIEVRNPSLINRMALINGIGGKTFYGVDFHNDKKFIKEVITLSDFTKKSVFLGESLHFTLSDVDPLSDVQFRGSNKSSFLKNEINYNFRMNFENINKREILCKGSLERYAGKIIEVAEVSADSFELLNYNLSGTWLIKKIVHNIVGQSYEQVITIIKDSIGSLLDKEEKDNLLASAEDRRNI